MTLVELPNGVESAYTYDDADRLTSVDPPAASPVAYTWDDNGNLTDRGTDEFLWDFEDRLVEATVDSVTTTFEYRGDGLRDSRTVGMTTTTFTWDIAAGIPVVLDDGTSRYVYGPSGLVAQTTSADDLYHLADGLGSIMAITDDIGDVVRVYAYDVYGQVTGGSGATPNDSHFAGSHRKNQGQAGARNHSRQSLNNGQAVKYRRSDGT